MKKTRNSPTGPDQDIAALIAYPPRQAAIQMIIDGRIDDYLQWARGDGCFAALGKLPENPTQSIDEIKPMPLDAALIQRIDDYAEGSVNQRRKELEIKDSLYSKAFSSIPYFYASPLEIALRSGNLASLETLLQRVTRPANRCADGRYGKRGNGWTSLDSPRLLYADLFDNAPSNPLIDSCRDRYHTPQLVMLACLLGNFEAAALLQRYGWAPDDAFAYADLRSPLHQTCTLLGENSPLDDGTASMLGIPKDTLRQAADWMSARYKLTEQLDDLFSEKDYAAIRDKAFALLDRGAAVTYYPLGVATEQNDLEMLRRLFDAGGDPNAVYKTGWSMLARLDSKKLSPEALQVWLDRGASPIKHIGADEPYGLSALAEWAWEGRLDLIRQAVEKAAAPIPLSFERSVRKEGDDAEFMQTFAPLLATAMSKGHLDLAVWLIRDKGLSLEYWDNWEGGEWEPCHTFASPEFLAKVKAAIA